MRRKITHQITKSVMAALMSASVLSCASSPLDSDEARELAASSNQIQRSMVIEVSCDDERYGTPAQWEEEIANVLWYLHASELVWARDELGRQEADEKISVHIKGDDLDAEVRSIDPQAATLDVLTWMTVPFLPLWIEDVDVGPGLTLDMSRSLRTLEDGWGEPASMLEVEVGEVRTSMSDRYPLWSWPTFGAVLTPPFLYRQGDPEHLEASIAKRVRLRAAVQIAQIVIEKRDGELLHELRIDRKSDGAWIVSCLADREVGKLTLRIDGKELPPREEDRPLYTRNVEERWSRPIPRDRAIRGQLLKIEALDRDERMVPYTIVLESRHAR